MMNITDGTHDDELQWLSVELISGTPIAELPDLQVDRLSVRMEEITECEANLPYDNAPVNWLEATAPYKVAILLVRGETVLWGGIVVKRVRTLGSASVNLALATFEHYLDSVYITTADFRQTSQTEIAQSLVGMTRGHRFPIDCVAYPSTVKRDRSYNADQDKTVLNALQELSQVINGPEWYSFWKVSEDGMTYTPCVVIADHIGSPTSSLVPATTFDSTILESFEEVEDYTNGYGANRVQANSTAEGEIKPTSSWHESEDKTRPVIEFKYTPSSSIVNISVLDQHAASKLKQMENGTTTFAFSASLPVSPRIGPDFNMGDLVTIDLQEEREHFPDISSPNVRVIGYDIEFQGAWKFTPVLRPVEQADAD